MMIGSTSQNRIKNMRHEQLQTLLKNLKKD